MPPGLPASASRPGARWSSTTPASIERADALGLFVVGLPAEARHERRR